MIGSGSVRMSTCKKVIAVLLMAAVLMSLCGCDSKPKKAECEVISMQFVDTVKINGVTAKYEGYKIVEVKLNAYSPEKFPTDAIEGKELRQKVFVWVAGGCSMYRGDVKMDNICGYWPEKATSYKAKEISLYFRVPGDAEINDLTFKLDGAVLGDPDYQFAYTPS